MAPAASRSSQKAKNVVIALLALWSIISLVIIVVWATSPDLKSSAQCRAELQETTEKLEGAKVVYNKNKAALEEMVEAGREERDHQRTEIRMLLVNLDATNATLEECRQEKVLLMGNMSLLQENIEQLHETVANLTAQVSLQEEHIEALHENMTQAVHKTTSCYSLKTAAESQMIAAQSQTKACESGQQYLQKQLHKCKEVSANSAQQEKQQETSTPHLDNAAPPLSGIPALILLLCSALHLITCESSAKASTCRTTESTAVQDGGGAWTD